MKLTVDLDQWVTPPGSRVQRHIGSGIEDYAKKYGVTVERAAAVLLCQGIGRHEASYRARHGESDPNAPAPGRAAKKASKRARKAKGTAE